MSADLLARIERDLCKMGEEIWNIDGPDDILDKVLERLSLLKAQLEVQKSLQATANLLRQVPSDKALPKQQATKVKHLVRFAFRKNSRQDLLERGKEGKEGKEGRHRKLRKLDCDALKLCGLSYTTEEMVKLGDAEFEILQKRGAAFISHRNLSYLLYRPDVDKAVDSKLEDPEDDELFDKFMQSHTARRLSTRKRKYDVIASPNEAAQALANNQVAEDDKARPSQESGEAVIADVDVFAVTKDDARYAMSSDQDQDIQSIFLTGTAFLTVWVSEEMGKYLGERGRKLDYKYRGFTEGLRRKI